MLEINCNLPTISSCSSLSTMMSESDIPEPVNSETMVETMMLPKTVADDTTTVTTTTTKGEKSSEAMTKIVKPDVASSLFLVKTENKEGSNKGDAKEDYNSNEADLEKLDDFHIKAEEEETAKSIAEDEHSMKSSASKDATEENGATEEETTGKSDKDNAKEEEAEPKAKKKKKSGKAKAATTSNNDNDKGIASNTPKKRKQKSTAASSEDNENDNEQPKQKKLRCKPEKAKEVYEKMLEKLVELYKNGMGTMDLRLLASELGYKNKRSDAIAAAKKILNSEFMATIKGDVCQLTEDGIAKLVGKEKPVQKPEEAKKRFWAQLQMVLSKDKKTSSAKAQESAQNMFEKLLDGKGYTKEELCKITHYGMIRSTGFPEILNAMKSIGFTQQEDKKISFTDKLFPFGRP